MRITKDKTSVQFIVFVVIIPVILFMLLGCFLAYMSGREQRIINMLNELDQKQDVIFISFPHIYYHDGSNFVCKETGYVGSYHTVEVLNADDNYIYLYTKNDFNAESELAVYRISKDLGKHEKIYTGEYSTNAYMKMYDNEYIYIFDDNCYSYDIKNNAADICDRIDDEKRDEFRYDIKNILKGFNSISLENGENSVSLTISDFENITETSEILNKYKLFFDVHQAIYADNCAYVVCSVALCSVIVYQYNFETEELSYYSWSKISDIELLKMFIIRND